MSAQVQALKPRWRIEEAAQAAFEPVPFKVYTQRDLDRIPQLDKLSDALSKALDDPGVRKRLLDLGSDIPGPDRRGQAALNKLVEGEIARWTPVIKESGVTQ